MGEGDAPSRDVQRYVVARVDEVPEGERLIVEAGGREIGIFNIEGEFYALRNRCPHLGGPLCEGEILGLVYSPEPGDVQFDASKKLLTCPWHGWEFDVKTGQSYFNPRLRARRYDVEVEREDAADDDSDDAAAEDTSAEDETAERVPGPYEAEVVPVSREQGNLVVTMRQRGGSAPAQSKAEKPAE